MRSGAAPAATEGMNEGTILVSGNADRDRMRRGMLVVKRDAGDHLGSRMVLDPTGRFVGLGMRRGTIVLG